MRSQFIFSALTPGNTSKPPEQSETSTYNNPATPWFRISLVVVLLVALFIVFTLPTRSISRQPADIPDESGIIWFSSEKEKDTQGNAFAWATQDKSNQSGELTDLDSFFLFREVPRYAPMKLTLRINLDRPSGSSPGILEIYQSTPILSEDGTYSNEQASKIATLQFDPNHPGTHDYEIDIPPITSGRGISIIFKSNTFQVGKDPRHLAFMFYGVKLEMGVGHIKYLIWPDFYLPAMIIFLACTVTWAWRVGLGWLANLAFNAQLAYVLMMAVQSTVMNSLYIMLLALLAWGLYFWYYRSQRKGLTGIWPLLLASGVIMTMFLFTNDELAGDTQYYITWGKNLHDHGIWNFYQNSPTYNYMPLMAYILWFYNLLAYPLGFNDSILAWRIFASLIYLLCVVVAFLIARSLGEKNSKKTPGEGYSLQAMLLLVGFNVSIFYNPTLWGQSDVISILPILLSFYFIYQKKPYLSGFALALTFISKPQAWLVMPVLLLMVPVCMGWRRGLLGLIPGFAFSFVLSVIAFGLNGDSLARYWHQGQLGGEDTFNFSAAYNLDYLLVPFQENAPDWLINFGYLIVGLVILLIGWRILAGARRPRETTAAIGLLNLAWYTFAVKMKVRYLVYGMPVLGLGTYFYRKLLWPYLLLSWLQLLNVSIIMFEVGRSRLRTLPENFYLWGSILSAPGVRNGIAVALILASVYLVVFYIMTTSKKSLVAAEATKLTDAS